MHYYLYQITCKVNNKIYVGVHKTSDLNDGYMGSGKVIKSAIAKHGILNFEKVILEYFDTSAAMYAKEKEVVDEEFLLREDVYNLRCGGYGGFDYINLNSLNGFSSSEIASKAAIKSNIGKSKFNKHKLEDNPNLALRFRLSIIEGMNRSPNKAMLNKKHSEKTKKLMSCAQTGDKNSQAGTMWITNDLGNKKIKRTDLIPDGYRKGRKLLQED